MSPYEQSPFAIERPELAEWCDAFAGGYLGQKTGLSLVFEQQEKWRKLFEILRKQAAAHSFRNFLGDE